MPDTSKLIGQEQDAAIWEGLNQLSQLPAWLVDARSPERVGEVLSQVIPEFRNGECMLSRCDTGHMLFKEDHWTGHYDVYARKPERPGATKGDAEQVFMLRGYIYPPGVIPQGKPQVSGALGSADWLAVLPELQLKLLTRAPETVLDSLAFLTDAKESRQYLEQHIRRGSAAYSGFTIQTCQPKIVRYKPGSRCTIVYHLGYPPDAAGKNWPELVVAKTYRGEKGQNAFDSMLALWNSALGKSSLGLAEPLAYDPERRILIQGPIREEQTLKELIISTIRNGGGGPALEALNEAMRKTAAGLADLHQSSVLLGREWAWADEISEVKKRIDRLAGVLPHLAPAADPLMRRLCQLEASSQPGPVVSSHGTFRPAQVLLHQGEIGFIDFDSFCQSEQANDLGLFICALMRAGLDSSGFEDDDEGETGQNEVLSPIDDAIRQAHFEMVCALSETFLAEYVRHLPVNRQRVALWAALDVMMLVTHGWIKIKMGELTDIMFLLERYLLENNFVGAA